MPAAPLSTQPEIHVSDFYSRSLPPEMPLRWLVWWRGDRTDAIREEGQKKGGEKLYIRNNEKDDLVRERIAPFDTAVAVTVVVVVAGRGLTSAAASAEDGTLGAASVGFSGCVFLVRAKGELLKLLQLLPQVQIDHALFIVLDFWN